MEELIKEFMAQKSFAVIGATDNPEKYGNKIFKNLTRRDIEAIVTDIKTIDEAVKLYLEGKLLNLRGRLH